MMKVTQRTGRTVGRLDGEGEDIVPIPGTRSPHRLAENAAAADAGLTPEDLRRIDEVLPGGAYGSRYPAAFMPQW